METFRAIMSKGVYPYSSDGSKASRFSVLEDESDKLKQPLISSHESVSYNCYYDSEPLDDDHSVDVERACYSNESARLLWHKNVPTPDHDVRLQKPTASSSAAVLRSIVSNVLWPLTAVGSQTAKAYEPRAASSSVTSAAAIEERNALHTVTTLQSLTKMRRRSESLDDIHEKALVRIAGFTLCMATWLIFSVYRASEV